MTSTTPDHNPSQCHAANEDRRQLLCRLKCLAERLDDCDKAALKAAGCSDLFASKGGRYVNPDPALVPLITYPENDKSDREPYVVRQNLPARKKPWEVPRVKSQELIGGYFKKGGCDCTHWNGLQDKCELPQCQGRPLCLTVPVPLCPSSGASALLVTEEEARAIIDKVDEGRCCRLSCCPGILENC